MQLRRATLIGVLILGLVSCFAYLRLRSPGDVDQGASRLPAAQQRVMALAGGAVVTNVADIAALREEVASLRAELLGQRRPLGALTSGHGTSQNSASADAGSSPQTREDAARDHQARVAAVDSEFRRQIIDPTWSAAASSAIRGALNNDAVGGIQADNIDCRSQSCRVELHDDGSGHFAKSLPLFALQLAGTLPNVTANTIPQPGGGSTVILYLSRQVEAAPAR